MADQVPYPLPQPTHYTARFWDACQKKHLEIPMCQNCDHLFLPGGPVCPKCWSQGIGYHTVSGRGSVFSYVVYHRTYHPAIPAPYVVAIIELDEGVKLVSNIVDCEPESITIGMQVEVVFELVGDIEPDFILHRFKPAGKK